MFAELLMRWEYCIVQDPRKPHVLTLTMREHFSLIRG